MSEPTGDAATKTEQPAPSEASATKGVAPEQEPAKRGPRDARTHPRPTVGDPLYPAWSALDRGDHAGARALAQGLLAHDDQGVREGAQDLLDRLKPDRVVLAVFALTFLLMLGLALAYLGRGHAH